MWLTPYIKNLASVIQAIRPSLLTIIWPYARIVAQCYIVGYIMKPESITDSNIQYIGKSYTKGFSLFSEKSHQVIANQMKDYTCLIDYPFHEPLHKEYFGKAFQRWNDLVFIYMRCKNNDTKIARDIIGLFEESFDISIETQNSNGSAKSPETISQEMFWFITSYRQKHFYWNKKEHFDNQLSQGYLQSEPPYSGTFPDADQSLDDDYGQLFNGSDKLYIHHL
jgi:hypothetical protein